MAADFAAVKAAFLAIRERPPAEHGEALAQISDAEIRREVGELLGFDGDERAFMAARISEEIAIPLGGDRVPPPIAGELLGERFEVQAPVTEGGFGWIYRGRDIARDEPVAIKLFKPIDDPGLASEVEAAFLREGRVLAQLHHQSPHIVEYRDVGTWRDGRAQPHPFIVMEWLDGLTLREYASRFLCEAGCSLADVIELLDPVAQALTQAHRAGVAHRDLKPSNVLVLGDPAAPELKLVDFGAAKVAADRARGFDSTGGVVGMVTYLYSAPELLSRTYGATGPWTDVYALALVITELLLGRHPWADRDVLHIMDGVLDEKLRPTPSAHGQPQPKAVEALLTRALAVDPKARPRDMAAFWPALRAAAEGRSRPSAGQAFMGVLGRLVGKKGD